MPRNTTMKERLSTALKQEPGGLKAVKPLPKEQLERAKRLRKSFRPYSEHTNDAAETVPITDVPAPDESPSPTEAELQSTLESIKSSSEAVVFDPPSVSSPIPPESLESSETETQGAQATQEPDSLRPNNSTADLEWLNRPTPLTPNLIVMVNSLRAAKTRIAFTFEQARAREQVKRQTLERAQFDLDQEETLIARLRHELSKVDDAMAGCALLAEQFAQITNLLTQPTGKTPRVIGEPTVSSRRDRNDPSTCRSADVLAFFQQNPKGTWNAKNVIRGLPSHKQDHARKCISSVLANLTTQGKLMRVAGGQYRLLS